MARVSLQTRAMHGIFRDVRYSVRALARTPLVTATAIATIGLGAGANATVASFVDALLFRAPAHVVDASSLVSVYSSDFSSGPYGQTSGPDFQSMVNETTAFSDIAASDDHPGVVVRIGASTERISRSAVTPTYFQMLGVRPTLGRFFVDSDTSGAPVAVIGHELWARAFGAKSSALGATIVFNDRSYTIVGVAPKGFEGLDLTRAREIWTVMPPASVNPTDRGSRGLNVIARFKRDSSIEQAQEQLRVLADRLAREYPDTNLGTLAHPDRPRPFTVTQYSRIGDQFRLQVTMIGGVLVTASLLVMVIAAANVGNLLLARSRSRQRELAIRLAVGASRRGIVRQLVIESTVLGIAGAVVGVLIALWTADALPSFFPAEQMRLLQARIDVRVLVFCLGVSLVASIVFGMAPAIQLLRPSPAGVLRRDGLAATESRVGSRMRRGFVVVQVTIAFVLLVGAGLLVKSLSRSVEADLGFGTRNGIVISVDLPRDIDVERGVNLYDEAIAAVRAVPAIQTAAFATTPPLSRGSRRAFRVSGYVPREGEDMEQFINTITTDYFDAMQIPFVAGRRFDERDTSHSKRVVIVNEEFARRYLNGDSIGQVVRDSSDAALEIVGIARGSAVLDQHSPVLPVVYYPLAQSFARSVRLIASVKADAAVVLPSTVTAIKNVSASIAVSGPATIQDQIDEALAADRLVAALVSSCGLLALALATVGLYGMVAYSVEMKRREIGIRIALGASTQRVSRLVLEETLTSTALGAAVGATLAIAMSTLIRSMLYEVSPADPATYAAVPVLLGIVSITAAWIPVRRALRVDPAEVLRQS